MIRRYSVNFALFSVMLDLISVLIGLSLGNTLHPWLEALIPTIKQVGDHEIPRLFLIVFPFLWVFLNLGISLYDGRRNVFFSNELLRLIVGIFVTTISMAGLLFFTSPETVHSLYITIIIIASILMVVWRAVVRLYWRHQYSCNKEIRRVLIIGAGKMGHQIEEKLSSPFYPNFKVIGFLDNDYKEHAHNQDVLGTVSDLEKIVNSWSVNIIVITLPSNAFDLTCEVVDRLRLTPVKIWVVPNATELARFHSKTEYLADLPVLDIRAPAISDRQRLLKRLFDLVFSSLVLLMTAPVMMAIAIMIKLDSPGSIFFRQKRVGENMQPFEMIKFRTMVSNADALSSTVARLDEEGNILHKHRDDPRITKIGRVLRRYSLDELPQFINVLIGNMSIVGPRPELPYLVERYKSWQYVRFTVPQGITGWWQVTGRSDKPLHLNTEDDFYYIKNYSIWLDLRIITKTFKAVVSGAGAF